jgi:hypothetical protein
MSTLMKNSVYHTVFFKLLSMSAPNTVVMFVNTDWIKQSKDVGLGAVHKVRNVRGGAGYW